MLQLKTYSPVPNNKWVLIKGGAVWGPADDLIINKWRAGCPNKRGWGVSKMFSVKSGNLLSLNMGVPNKTSQRHI